MAAAMEIDDESAVAGADRSGNKKRFEVKKVKTGIWTLKLSGHLNEIGTNRKYRGRMMLIT